MSRSNKKKKQKNKINEPAVKIQTERDIPPKSSLEADEDIAGMASAAGILSDISSETKKEAAEGASRSRRARLDISELDDHVKEIIDDALDENAEDLGVTDEQTVPISSAGMTKALSAVFGAVILIFAIYGIITAAVKIKDYTEAKNDNSELTAYFESLVLPLSASDIPAFEGVSSLNRDVLITAACWDVILSPSATYAVENGYYTVSYLELDTRINKLFGKGLEYAHGTVGDEELTFEYDEATGMYKIPTAPRAPAYYPSVDNLEPFENGYVLTVGYRTPVTKWISTESSPDKIMLISVTPGDIGYTVSSVEVGEIINDSGL